MTPRRKPPRQRRRVDHRYIAELCARHASGDYVAAAEHFCQSKGLGTLDKLRIKRLAAQREAIQAAIDAATKR